MKKQAVIFAVKHYGVTARLVRPITKRQRGPANFCRFLRSA